MKHDEIQDEEAGNKNSNDREENLTDRLDTDKNPLPENILEYVQKARDELKRHEEQKEFYEKRRNREIVFELISLLEEHEYPKEWLRHIIAREFGDYISTSYIEKIIADSRVEKTVKEQSQTAEIPQIDNKMYVELFTTAENVVANDDDLRNANLYYTNQTSTEVSTEFKAELERQVEKGAQEIVKKLQEKVRDLKSECYQLDQLTQEGSMWKKRYTQLQQEFSHYRNKTIKGTQIEFGSELLLLKLAG